MRSDYLKIHHGFERIRLRGLSDARDEFHLGAIVQNLKTMALPSNRLPTDGKRRLRMRRRQGCRLLLASTPQQTFATMPRMVAMGQEETGHQPQQSIGSKYARRLGR
jgi:hypothetical protein